MRVNKGRVVISKANKTHGQAVIERFAVKGRKQRFLDPPKTSGRIVPVGCHLSEPPGKDAHGNNTVAGVDESRKAAEASGVAVEEGAAAVSHMVDMGG